METVSLNLKYRPLRIGWCIEANDLAALRKTMRLNYLAWGGTYNFFINIDKDATDTLIQAYQPDLLLAATESTKVHDTIKRYKHLYDPYGLNHFMSDGRPIVLDITHPIETRNNEIRRDGRIVHLPIWDDSDPLQDLLLATVGAYPDSREVPKIADIIVGKGMGRGFKIEKDLPVDERLQDFLTPFLLTKFDISQSHYCNQRMSIFVGDSSSFDDLVTYWNLRAALGSIFFFDSNHAARLEKWKKKYLALHTEFIARASQFARGLNFYSNSDKLSEVIHDHFNTAVEKISHFLSPHSWSQSNLNPTRAEFSNVTILGHLADKNEWPKASLELKDKPTSRDTSILNQKFIVVVRPIHCELVNDQFTFHAIHIPQLNHFYSRHCLGTGPDEIRSHSDGLGIIIGSTDSNLNLRAIRKHECLEKLFELYGYNISPSQAGLIAKQCSLQMGGIQSCRVFKVEGVRNLLEESLHHQSFNFDAAKAKIGNRDPQTSKPQFDKFKDLRIEYRTTKDLTPSACFQFLVKKDVLRAGLSVSCNRCKLNYWVGIDQVRALTKCEYCGSKKNIAPHLKGLEWQYRKSGLFDHHNKQEGAIPVLLTMQQIDTCLHDSKSIYLFATNIVNINTKTSCESDFIIARQNFNGKIDLVLAECKTRKPIEKNDLEKLTSVAKSFPKEFFDVYILLSKLKAFTVEEVEMICSFNDSSYHQIIMWGPRELEPYDVFQNIREEYEFNTGNKRLDGLAVATLNTYFAPNRKSKL